jgi:2-methylcitrate dehydratase
MATAERYVRDDLADLVLGIQYDELGGDVVNEGKRLVLDTLACAYGGIDSEPARIVAKTVADLGGSPQSSVIGAGSRASMAGATLVNGTMMRYLDNNDYYFGRDPSHASGNLAPALAVAEYMGLGGSDVLLAFAIAYEVQLRLCDHAGEPNIWERGWHHGTNMQFASAALAARLLGLDAVGVANAIAIAGSHNNTLAQSQRGNIPMMKASAEATIAKGGVEAALMAMNGLTGPEEIFEGGVGWRHAVAGEVDFAALVRPVDGHYRIMDTCMKPYAAEMMTQAPIQAAIDVIKDNGIDIAAIGAIEARFHEYAFKKPSWDPKKLVPKDRETADHSFPYCIAVAMIEGDCGPKQFRQEMLESPQVRALMARTELTTDAGLTANWPYASGAAIAVTLETGERFESVCEYPPGHPRNRESDARIENKFRRLSAGILGDDQADEIIAAVRALDDFEKIGDFMGLLTVRG